ncbi:hypothetical protein H8356DRAFT_1657865 [Neocallimastix lanati (nom. inval.)]|nr:hypothetical protein H8356DRAFT_1657865 [Neocallimastix sp. JGI-2020a]
MENNEEEEKEEEAEFEIENNNIEEKEEKEEEDKGEGKEKEKEAEAENTKDNIENNDEDETNDHEKDEPQINIDYASTRNLHYEVELENIMKEKQEHESNNKVDITTIEQQLQQQQNETENTKETFKYQNDSIVVPSIIESIIGSKSRRGSMISRASRRGSFISSSRKSSLKDIATDIIEERQGSTSSLINEIPMEESQFTCDLWIGKGTSKDEIRRAIEISKWISELMSSEDPLEVNKPNNFGYDINDNPISDLSINGNKYQLNLIQEGSETNEFWMKLGVDVNKVNNNKRTLKKKNSTTKKNNLNICYGKGTRSWRMKPPRFFKCDCSKGNFSVREIENFSQYDLSDDCCIILDSNSPGKLYVWIGRNSSDVVRKLTQKSVEVWLSNVNDGRWYNKNFLTLSKDDSMTSLIESESQLSGNDESLSSSSELINEEEEINETNDKASCSIDPEQYIKRVKENKAKREDKKNDVVVEYQGEESIEFKSFFFGWSNELTKNIDYDPGNSYTKEMERKRAQREKELAGTDKYYEPVVYELRNCNLK